MVLEDIALFGVEGMRTRAYLSRLGNAGLVPARFILIGSDGSRATGPATGLFDNETPARLQAENLGCPVVETGTSDINDAEAVRAVESAAESVLIFSGPGGSIVKKPLFATGKRFLHVHPGRVPDFRGSTTIYYSLLKEERVEATAIFLEERIDTGPLLQSAAFSPPEDRTMVDTVYDPFIRASLLVRVMRSYAESGTFDCRPQPEAAGKPYYVIHPVLKHIAIYSTGRREGTR